MINIHNNLNYTNMSFINENEQGVGRWSQYTMSIRPNVYKIDIHSKNIFARIVE